MSRHISEPAMREIAGSTSSTPSRRLIARMGAVRLRHALAVVVAALVASALTPSMASSHTHLSGPKPTVVLVHGAFADASSWSDEIRTLQNDGYTVLAPANPLRGIASDAAYLRSVLATISGPIVLVAHSYGGAVITNAASGNPNVKALVYVAAFAPDEGETLAEAFAGSQDSLLTPDALDIRPYPLPGGGTGADAYIKPDRFHEIFAADLPTPVTNIMASTQRPLDAGVLQEPTHDPAWKTIPSWFLLPTDDRVIGTDAERAMAERAGSQIIEVRASHAVLVSQPTKVTKLIEASRVWCTPRQVAEDSCGTCAGAAGAGSPKREGKTRAPAGGLRSALRGSSSGGAGAAPAGGHSGPLIARRYLLARSNVSAAEGRRGDGSLQQEHRHRAAARGGLAGARDP